MPFTTNEDLVLHLLSSGALKTPTIIQAFRLIDRADFVPETLQQEAYADYPLPIGFGQTISQPSTVAFMLELLQPQLNDMVLEVGSGSGYVAALLGTIVGSNSQVVAVERERSLITMSAKKIHSLGLSNIKFVYGDGTQGYISYAPYEKIIVSAAAPAIPKSLIDQMTNEATMVIPVGTSEQSIVKIEIHKAKQKITIYPGFAFVPLVAD